MKRELRKRKNPTYKIKRMNNQRRNTINRIRKHVVLQANIKFRQEIEKYCEEFSDSVSECSHHTDSANSRESSNGKNERKRVLIDESSNQEYEYHLWQKLTQKQNIDEKSASQEESNGECRNQLSNKVQNNAVNTKMRTRSKSHSLEHSKQCKY